VAVISDRFYSGPHAIGYALGTMSGGPHHLAFVMAVLLVRSTRRAKVA
jgi:hypothetical protein